MIYVRLKGGIGNQLFQYAAGYALAKRTNQSINFDTSFFATQSMRKSKLNNFNIDSFDAVNIEDLSYPINLLKSKTIGRACRVLFRNPSFKIKGFGTYLMESRNNFFDAVLNNQSKNVYLDGYFQSEKYFDTCKEDIRRQFTLSCNKPKEYDSTLADIIDCNSIAVHVRRGDFIAKNKLVPKLKIRYVLDTSYYNKAINHIVDKIDEPIFYWFSDDIDWVKENFGEKDNYRFISLNGNNADILEMSLMSQCKHIISANSTFSWWATWLNSNESAIKIVPSRQYGCNDMIPNNWIKI